MEIIERILNIKIITNIHSSNNFNSLLQRLENIEKIVVVKKQAPLTLTQIENYEEDIEVETVKPLKRLLSKK